MSLNHRIFNSFNYLSKCPVNVGVTRLVPVLLLVILCSCQFSAPDLDEQDALMRSGVFPKGRPQWMATRGIPTFGDIDNSLVGTKPVTSGGLDEQRQVPRVFADRVTDSNQSVENSKKGNEVKVVSQGRAANDDPSLQFAQVIKICPELEKPLMKAVLTESAEPRIAQMQILSRTCQSSGVLWSWLGQEYMHIREWYLARDAFERAAVLEPANENYTRGKAQADAKIRELESKNQRR